MNATSSGLAGLAGLAETAGAKDAAVLVSVAVAAAPRSDLGAGTDPITRRDPVVSRRRRRTPALPSKMATRDDEGASSAPIGTYPGVPRSRWRVMASV